MANVPTFAGVFTLLVVLLSAVCIVSSCPTGCSCSEFRNSIYCSSSTLPGWPADSGVTWSVDRLQIICRKDVQIKHLKKDDFAHYANITRLDIIQCGLEDITDDTFEFLTRLTTFSLLGNNLKSIHQNTFTLIVNLEDLNLAHNAIETVPDNAFIHLKKLKSLRLSFNKIRSVGKHAFEDLPELGDLYIEHNENLSFVDEEAFLNSHIDYLRIGHSNLDSGFVKALKPLQDGLIRLDWTDNGKALNLPADSFEGFNLASLDLSRNQITNIDFLQKTVSGLIKLDYNNITDIDLSNCPLPTLVTLYLNSNQIKRLDLTTFKHITTLRYLTLGKNKIEELIGTLAPFQHMLHFGAPGNKIRQIPNGMFKENKFLTRVELYDNDIATIDGSMFPRDGVLTYLELNGNNIETIPVSMEAVIKSTMLEDNRGYMLIYDNPIHCNCELKWLRKLLTKRDDLLSIKSLAKVQTNCTTPNNINFQLVSLADMACDVPVLAPVLMPINDDPLWCNASGDPTPKVEWRSTSGTILASKLPIRTTQKFISLPLPQSDLPEGGDILCVASSTQGNATAHLYTFGASSARAHFTNVGRLIAAAAIALLICII
ncbi:unnamed protein product [Owenia fusiformis]|uniref:Ig-like domain-containing protein n=1 Tax=Owenia fusiformis TaxID=6347 RepID=A0A8S4P4S5_OWEFU|nr:unnamed protein product [Owenia fusiformis]